MATSRPRTWLATAGSSMSLPFQRTEPRTNRPGGRTMPSMASPITLLPEPDSPTTPSRSWEPTLRVRPSTPYTVPSRVGNPTVRSAISSSRSGASLEAAKSAAITCRAGRG